MSIEIVPWKKDRTIYSRDQKEWNRTKKPRWEREERAIVRERSRRESFELDSLKGSKGKKNKHSWGSSVPALKYDQVSEGILRSIIKLGNRGWYETGMRWVDIHIVHWEWSRGAGVYHNQTRWISVPGVESRPVFMLLSRIAIFELDALAMMRKFNTVTTKARWSAAARLTASQPKRDGLSSLAQYVCSRAEQVGGDKMGDCCENWKKQ